MAKKQQLLQLRIDGDKFIPQGGGFGGEIDKVFSEGWTIAQIVPSNTTDDAYQFVLLLEREVADGKG